MHLRKVCSVNSPSQYGILVPKPVQAYEERYPDPSPFALAYMSPQSWRYVWFFLNFFVARIDRMALSSVDLPKACLGCRGATLFRLLDTKLAWQKYLFFHADDESTDEFEGLNSQEIAELIQSHEDELDELRRADRSPDPPGESQIANLDILLVIWKWPTYPSVLLSLNRIQSANLWNDVSGV